MKEFGDITPRHLKYRQMKVKINVIVALKYRHKDTYYELNCVIYTFCNTVFYTDNRLNLYVLYTLHGYIQNNRVVMLCIYFII